MSFESTLRLGRKAGRGLFCVFMAMITIGFILMGAATARDALDGQQVLWGTFTEQDCEPAHRGCQSIGTWVSDDGTIIREGIYLDGRPGADGTTRASFQPEGILNDSDNNIVHAPPWSGAMLWMSWVGALLTAGAAVFQAYEWRRECH